MNVCLYHRSDLDGQCSAAIYAEVQEELGKNYQLYGIDYGDPISWDLIDDNRLAVLDWSFQPLGVFLQALRRAKSLLWIDHHRSAIKAWTRAKINPEDRCPAWTVLNENYAACELTWGHFHPSIPIPRPVHLLGRYDVWDHSDPDTLPYQYGLRLLDLDPKSGRDRGQWEKILGGDHEHLAETIHNGQLILKYQAQDDAKAVSDTWFPLTFAGKQWQGCNRLRKGSQFFNSVWDSRKYHGMLAFGWHGQKQKWQVGLYSDREDVDCGAIAKEYGGGGHPGASGFLCDKLPFDLARDGQK